MNDTVVRFEFLPDAAMDQVGDYLEVAAAAVAGLHGASAVALDAGYVISESDRTVSIDTSTEAGNAMARIFHCLVQRGIGLDGYRVHRATVAPAAA